MSHVEHIETLPSSIPAMAAISVGQEVSRWEYTPKNATDDDVDFVVLYNGLCHSDLHMINNDWGMVCPEDPEKSLLPLVPGHEVVGRVLKVGKNYQGEFKEGDIVGLGAQSFKCGNCHMCGTGDDNACDEIRLTYCHKFSDSANPGGVQHYGGFSSALRTHGCMLFKIPDALKPEYVGPLLCAGITVYAPLDNHKVTKGTKVGIYGVGGLGHVAVQFAAKMGAEVVCFSRGTSKKDLCMTLGASEYVDSTDDAAMAKHNHSLDLLLVTMAGGSFDVEKNIPLCKKRTGVMHFVGAIEEPLKVNAFPLIMSGVSITGSLLGTSQQIKDMLRFAADHQVAPMIEVFPHSAANEAIKKMIDGGLRFRAVLKNDLLPKE